MKHLRLFKTNADYESAILDLPNVSYVEETGYVFCIPNVKLITFTIDKIEYKAKEGTTWAEWCESESNTLGLYVYGNRICHKNVYRSVCH